MVKIGINGFGRIGRQILKIAISKCKEKGRIDAPKVAFINDPKLTSDCMAYLLERDSFYGKFCPDVTSLGNALTIDGQRIEISHETAVDKIPWSKASVDYVVDCSGANNTCDKAALHLKQGVKRVILTAICNAPIFVMGVNNDCYNLDMKVVSAGSPTLNCLATLLRVLHENYEIDKAVSLAFHPLNSSSNLLDAAGATCRSGRSAMMTFSPTESMANGKTLSRIMPELDGKTQSTAVRVCAPCVGAIDVTATFFQEAPYEAIQGKLVEAGCSYMKGILKVTKEEVISTDIIGTSHSCIVDGNAGVGVTKCCSKIFAWYDAECGFANRVYDLVNYLASRENCK